MIGNLQQHTTSIHAKPKNEQDTFQHLYNTYETNNPLACKN